MIDDSELFDLSNVNLNGVDAARYIKNLAASCQNPTTDGFTQCSCKHQLYMLKCLIEDLYKDLPEFPQQEKEWEQQRILELLKR